MTRFVRFALIVGVLTVLTVGCSATPAATASLGPVDASISAKDLAFSTQTLDVPAGRAFTIGFTNQESAPHNIAIAGAGGNFDAPLFRGDVITNAQVTYAVSALPAGQYAFRCDVHTNMTGTIVAK